MAKLKKFRSLFKDISFNSLFCKYHFLTSKSDFLVLRNKRYRVKIINDRVSFYGYKSVKNEMIQNKIEFEEQNVWKSALNELFIKRFLMFFTIVIMSLIFIFSQKLIREVKFVENEMYDKRVYDYVISKLDHKGYFYTYERDLNKLSNELRITFPNYAYIGIKRNASVLLIDIEKRPINEIKVENKRNCDIISQYDAIVNSIFIEDGVGLVEINQFVKKGSTLVSGNLLIKNDPENFSKLIPSKAIILGTTLEYKTIVVPKKIYDNNYTSKLKKKINIKIGNKLMFKFKNYYEQQQVQIDELFSIFKIFKIIEERYYELSSIEITLGYSDAYNFAVSRIYSELDIKRVSELERIVEVELISNDESEDEFIFKFIVKKVQNIGENKYY